MNRFLAAMLLMTPGLAMADPVTIIATAVKVWAVIKPIVTAITILSNINRAVQARRKARKAAIAARNARNAALTDRSVSGLVYDPPHRCIYGRTVTGGDVVAMFTTDKAGVRDDGSAYTKPDALRHIVIHLQTRQAQAIHEVFIDGKPVGTLDGGGWAVGGEFASDRNDTRRVSFANSINLTGDPAVEIVNAYAITGSGDGTEYTNRTVAITGGGMTLTEGSGDTIYVDYRTRAKRSVVRISKFLGAPGQVADAYLRSVIPSKWTVDHRLPGLAGIVVTLDLEDPRFQGGLNNITADVSGALLYDPRKDSTVPSGSGAHRVNDPTTWEHSDNNALCSDDWLRSEMGYGVAPSDIDVAETIAAANACDVLQTIDGASRKTYTCNGAFTSEESREKVLEDLAESMAGSIAPSAQWMVQAGEWSSPILTLTDDDLKGQLEIVQADTPMDDLINSARVRYFPAGKSSPAELTPPYKNAALVGVDGKELWRDLELPFTDNKHRATNIARILVEQARNGQILKYPAKMRAWGLRVGRRARVISAQYGIDKTYRCTDWGYSVMGACDLVLQEDDATIYDLADAPAADSTPTSDLPNPWAVGQFASLTVTSGNATLIKTLDGTVVPRVRVQWPAVTAADVINGGSVVVQWRRNDEMVWRRIQLPGDALDAYILDVREGDIITVGAFAINARLVQGDPAFVGHKVVGKSAPPPDATGLAGTVSKGRIPWGWDAPTFADYAQTEARLGGTDWASATFAFRGRASQWQHVVSAAATYILRIKHIDESGNYSVNALSASVVVVAGDLVQDGANAPPTVQLSLSVPSVIFQADSTGLVDAGQSFAVTALVRVDNVDDTANWTVTRTPGSGVTASAMSGASCNVTSLATGTDASTLTIDATRAGFPSQSLTIPVTKLKRQTPASGPVASPGPFFSEVNVVAPSVAEAAARVLRNGQVEVRMEGPGAGWEVVGNWYSPTTTNIGDSYEARAELVNGPSPSSGVAIGSWNRINASRAVFRNRVGGGQEVTAIDISVRPFGGGAVVSTFRATLYATVE
ncbi:MAG: hypothetical protein ACRCV9_06845 [Burkholderiaceae bacterium]